MRTEVLINRLKDLRDNGECVSETAVLEQAIKTIEALNKIRTEIEKNGQSDISAEYVLDLIDKHLAEAKA